jgi:hypothetical protein
MERVRQSRHRVSDRWWVLAVLLLAAALRLWQLGEVPPGFQFDEAHNAIDAARVLDGQLAVFFPDNGGREPLLTYIHAPLVAALGRDHAVLALRLVSAFAGMVTVALVHRAVGEVLGDRRLGLLAAGFLAVSYWHLHFSRYAIRAILAPLWTTGAVWAWWRALTPLAPPLPLRRRGGEDGRGRLPRWARWAALAGTFMAAAAYSHPSGRLVPLILIGHAVYLTVADRAGGARAWRALVVAGVVAFVLFLPLGLFFVQYPGLFTAHPSDVSLAAVAARDHGGSILRALAANLSAVGGMFFLAGDPSTFHNLPDLPVFDPLSALAAVIGGGVVLGMLLGRSARRRERAVLLLLWLVVMLLPTVLSDRPPNYSRAMSALPIIVTMPAIGLRWLGGPFRTRPGGGRPTEPRESAPGSVRAADPRLSAVLRLTAPAVLVLAAMWTARHYFVVFGNRTPHVYYSYDVDKLDAQAHLVGLAEEAEVFLHPLWAQHATIAYSNADGPVRELDGTDTLVLPAESMATGRDVVVAFPAVEAEREGWLDRAESLYGEVAERDDLPDAQGRPLLVTYRVSPSAIGDLEPPTDAALEPEVWTKASFGGAIQLAGYSADSARPGEPLPVTFVWQAVEPVWDDFTLFVHLTGPREAAWGQEDREPGNVSYRTSGWEPGDVVIDRYRPALSPDAAGMLWVQVGWYDLETGQRLEVADDAAFGLKPIEVRR